MFITYEFNEALQFIKVSILSLKLMLKYHGSKRMDRFRREPARNKPSLTPDTGAVFLLPNPVIFREFLTAAGDFSAGSYLKLLEPASGVIDLEHALHSFL